jgi:hypothetical protein
MNDIQQGQNEGQGKEPVEMPATDKPVEVSTPPVEEARPAEATGELPEGVTERTRQEFEKLKAHNKEMAEKLKSLEQPQAPWRSAFDMLTPQGQPVQVPQPIPVQAAVEEIKPVVPDENGYVDINTLNQTIAQVNERSRRVEERSKTAEQKASEAVDRVSKYEHTDKTLKTYAQHPYLDPNGDKFDQKFSELVSKELLYRMYSGGSQDYLEAANQVKAKYYDPTATTEVKPVPEKKDVTKRDLVTPPTGAKVDKDVDQDKLVSESYRGNKDAIYQRLKNSGY